MTQAGWYPDPAGQPQTYRYWDGSTWSDATTGDPYAPPPGPPAPPPPPPDAPTPPTPPPGATVLAPGATPGGYGAVPPAPVAPPGTGYGQPPYGGGYAATTPSAGGSSRIVLIAVAAAVVLVLLGVGGFLGIRALTGDDNDGGGAASDSHTVPTPDTTVPTSPGLTTPTEPTAPSSPDSSGPTEQQCKGGIPDPTRKPNDRRILGGGLSIPVPNGYTAETQYSVAFTWADDFTPLQKVIEQNDQAQTGWVSIYGVGGLRKTNGFTDPAQAAEAVMECMAASADLYQDFTGRTDVSSGAITVDGKDAFQVTAELRVDNPDLDVEGDVAEVVVVDTGDPDTFGLFLSVVPIGNQQLIDQQTAFTDQIRVR